MLDLSGPLVLDGGLSTALEQQGADLGGALWTARLLADEPARIAAAHRSFFDAGARVATTASYQASVEGLVAAGYDAAEARRLITAQRDHRPRGGRRAGHPGSLVAASVGPYGAYLADGSEYTGRYGVTAARLRDFHGPRLELLAAAGPTCSPSRRSRTPTRPRCSWTLLDEIGAARVVQLLGARRTPPARASRSRGVRRAGRGRVARRRRRELLGPGRRPGPSRRRRGDGLPAVAYPNRGGSWDADAKRWAYGDPLDLDLVAGWLAAGARLVGGCCGNGPADIAALARNVAVTRPG